MRSKTLRTRAAVRSAGRFLRTIFDDARVGPVSTPRQTKYITIIVTNEYFFLIIYAVYICFWFNFFYKKVRFINRPNCIQRISSSTCFKTKGGDICQNLGGEIKKFKNCERTKLLYNIMKQTQ